MGVGIPYGDNMTERGKTRTNYFPQFADFMPLYYDYQFDSRGNIMKIVRRNKETDKITFEVNIKYVE